MMQKLKEEITAAANRELNRANEQFPLFTSKHEGVAVAYKELEESKEALEELEASFKCLWDDVRGKETPCYLKEEITPLKIADYAINLACEAVQTAAMLMKYEMSLAALARGTCTRALVCGACVTVCNLLGWAKAHPIEKYINRG